MHGAHDNHGDRAIVSVFVTVIIGMLRVTTGISALGGVLSPEGNVSKIEALIPVRALSRAQNVWARCAGRAWGGNLDSHRSARVAFGFPWLWASIVAVRLTPNLQYIVSPDQNNEPFQVRPIPNAFVIGAKLSVDLFTLAGLARGPGSL